jgi:cytochrome c biogenesis protein CcdA
VARVQWAHFINALFPRPAMDLITTPIALLAGMLTIASPCVLPLLPVLLGTALERPDRWRPVFVVAGFVLAFAGLGIALSVLSNLNASVHDAVRHASIALLPGAHLAAALRLADRPHRRAVAATGISHERRGRRGPCR